MSNFSSNYSYPTQNEEDLKKIPAYKQSNPYQPANNFPASIPPSMLNQQNNFQSHQSPPNQTNTQSYNFSNQAPINPQNGFNNNNFDNVDINKFASTTESEEYDVTAYEKVFKIFSTSNRVSANLSTL